MTTDLKPAATQAPDILDKAVEHLERVGHFKGYLYDEAQADEGTPLMDCRVDAVGAILAAAFGQPRFPADTPDSAATDAALSALAKTTKQGVPGWNDDPERTQDEVVDALRNTAAALRAGRAK